jgi:hypothetical protein
MNFGQSDMKKIFAIMIFLILYNPSKINAGEKPLPFGDKKELIPLEMKAYDLKVKLKPKIIESVTYWQDQEKIDWQKEINNWHFGFFPRGEIIPPFILTKEGFYPRKNSFGGSYFWISNNARLRIINFLEADISTNLLFWANSYKKDRKLRVFINGEELKKILIIPSTRKKFNQFIIEDIALKPGENELVFFAPEGTDKLRPEGISEKIKDVSIKIKDDFRCSIVSKLKGSSEPMAEYKYTLTDKALEIVPFFKRGQDKLIMSRDIDVDLEQHPLAEFDFMEDGITTDIFLGIDYSGDKQIDDYLFLKDLKKTNLFEMAKEKWKDVDWWKYGFRLVKMVLIFHPDGWKRDFRGREEIYQVRLKNFKFYNPTSAIYIPLWSKQSWQLEKDKDRILEDIFNTSYKSYVDREDNMIFSVYFDSREIGTETVEKVKEEIKIFLKTGKEFTGEVVEKNDVETKLVNIRELGGESLIVKNDAIAYSLIIPKEEERRKLWEEEEVVFSFPVDCFLKDRAIFKLVYKLEDPSIQDIEVFLDVDRDGDGRVNERVMVGEKEILRGWQFIGAQSDMDLYETFASLNFPESYRTTPEIKKMKFIVYKGDTPLKTTRDKWYRDIELAEVGAGQPRRIVVSVPQGELPGDNYSIIYYPLPREGYFPKYQRFEADISWLARKYSNLNIKNISLHLKRKEEVDLTQERKGWYNFYLKSIGLYHKFAYPIKDEKLDAKLIEETRRINRPLVILDNELFGTNSFEDWTDFSGFERGGLIQKRINLTKGRHSIKILENDTFEVEYAILEPVTHHRLAVAQQKPEITFRKINPTKYYVRVQGAKSPFWLVFSESFRKQWRIYRAPEHQNTKAPEFAEVVADYPELGVREARHLTKFTPQDIKFLFEKPLEASHHLVNGYANGWYIDPERLKLGEDFILAIYFFPQTFFYLGLAISGLTFTGCLVYILKHFLKKGSMDVTQ